MEIHLWFFFNEAEYNNGAYLKDMQSEIKLVLIFNFRIYLRIEYTQNDTPEKNRQKRVMLYKALTAMIRKNNLVLHEKEIHSLT